MSLLNRIIIICIMAPLSACSSSFDAKITPPTDAQWVTLSVKVPQDLETLPMDVLYRSQICQQEVYDNMSELHMKQVPARNPQEVSLIRSGNSDIYQAKIAVNGGGSCQWELSVIRMRMQFKADSVLAKGKKSISSSMVFAFNELGAQSSFVQDGVKNVYGDQKIKIKYFPNIFINHMFNKTTLRPFGGNTKELNWSRDFWVHNTKEIFVEPLLHIDKIVVQESPGNKSSRAKVTYPDGSVVYSDDIDYHKLISIR